MPTNLEGKKSGYKIDYFILHTVILVMIILFIIAIICYHYTKDRQKTYWCNNNTKIQNNQLENFSLKIVSVIILTT